jgi:hypothetical protein
LRALTGGRYRPPPVVAVDPLPLGAEWRPLLVQLGVPANVFREVLARSSLHPHFQYRRFSRPKKDGTLRQIAEPDVQLKRIQREIIARCLRAEQPHAVAIAYRPKRSVAHHVWGHAGAEVLITADVADFFPATSAGRVEDWWRGRFDAAAARLLTLLTTDRGGLPQGAPTSPPLSNLVNHELDERLARRSAAAGACYTRYCDDMVFSWPPGLGPPADFEAAVRAALHEYGYALHPRKGWRVYHRRDEPEVTGLILTRHGGVRLPEHLRRVMHTLRNSDDPHDADRLAGYRGYEAMVRKRPRQ